MRLRPLLGLVLALGAVAFLAACGGGEQPSWDGPPRPLSADRALPVEGFNAYLDSVDEPWERSAVGVATAYALPVAGDTNDLHAAVQTGDPDGNVIVSVTIATLDDSVRALRFVLSFDPLRDGEYRLLDVRWDQRCQVGRGHQGWSRELCV